MFESIRAIENTGFVDFVTIHDLRENRLGEVPEEVGVYLVLSTDPAPPGFLRVNPAGHVGGADPTVRVRELRANWVDRAIVLYIGKAGGLGVNSTLRSRIQQFLHFGAGLQTPHRGGMYIWQVRGSESFVVCWKQTTARVPRGVEHQLIAQFKDKYDGRRPFANLLD